MPFRRRRDAGAAKRPIERHSDPMVNRHLELDLLREHLNRTMDGAGHAVIILGESGVGKSRLVAELLTEVEGLGMVAMRAQCLGRGAEPLLPVKDALVGYLGDTGDHVRRTLLGAAPRLLDAIPFIGAFLGKLGESLLDERRLRASLDGISEELSRLLLGISEKHGLCLAVEDLHLADQDTLFFLNYFIRKIRHHRVLTLFTIQLEQLREAPHLADFVARWAAEGYANLTVFPLERAHVGEYVQTLSTLGVAPDDDLVDRLFSLTGGNPFYLKETLQLLAGAETGSPESSDEFMVPPKVDAVLRRRLQRAQGTTRQLLEAASVVLETTQDVDAIAFAMDVPAGAAVRAFTEARDLLLMREGPTGEIGFVHSLMQRTVYGDLGTTYRRYLHRRAAEWSENTGALASAAFHFERADRTADLVRTGLQAAERAEHAGMYHSALALYQKVRPHVSIEDVGPPLVRTMITLGEWEQAEEVIASLPAADGRVRLLRSQLAFVLGDFRRAQDEAQAALQSAHVDRPQVLTQLADIALYLGDFAQSRRYARESLAASGDNPPPAVQIPYFTLLGVTAYHQGDLDEGETQYGQALELVRRNPPGERDVLTETMLMGNLGNIALVRGDLATAERLHGDALRMRREVADARGALHSLHALGRCRLAAGDRSNALTLFDEADQLAASLGETLERAKIGQTRSELALRDGNQSAAYELAQGALASFERSECRYDVTHAQLALSTAAKAAGRERENIELMSAARATVELWGYRLLAVTYPAVNEPPTLAERIAGGLTAYACGDGLGLPYENLPPSGASVDEIETPHARGIWHVGDTSDDTALTLLAARCLVETGGAADPLGFLRRLADHDPPVQGMGPSTTAAIEHFRSTGEILDDQEGSTNGAPMRSLPCGWAVNSADTQRLLRLTVDMTQATHRSPDALVAACVMATCGSWSLEGASPALLLEIAQETAVAAQHVQGGGPRLAGMLAELAAGTWTPPAAGVSMDPAETVTAVLSCVLHAPSLRDALIMAVRLGGDADTVAAMVGGLIGVRMTPADVRAELPWSSGISLPAAADIEALAQGLAGIRIPTGERRPER